MKFVILPSVNKKYTSAYVSASIFYKDNYTTVQVIERSGDRVITFMFHSSLPDPHQDPSLVYQKMVHHNIINKKGQLN